MNKRTLFILWGGLFALCAALGFISSPGWALQFLMTMLAVAFFIPGALLLHMGKTKGDRELILLVRNFSAASLSLTALLIIANFLSVFGSDFLGSVLHCVLAIVSTPMICSGYWVLSLFLWACLMIWAMKILGEKKS